MRYWTHGIELDNLDGLNVPYKIIQKDGWDDYFIEVSKCQMKKLLK